MYSIHSQLLSYHNGHQCPECFKEKPKSKLHKFKTSRGLAIHLHQHSMSVEERQKITMLSKAYLLDQNKKSFLSLCFKVGLLY